MRLVMGGWMNEWASGERGREREKREGGRERQRERDTHAHRFYYSSFPSRLFFVKYILSQGRII